MAKVRQMTVILSPTLLRELFGSEDVVLMGARSEFGRLFLDLRGLGGEGPEDGSIPRVESLGCFEQLKVFRADNSEIQPVG